MNSFDELTQLQLQRTILHAGKHSLTLKRQNFHHGQVSEIRRDDSTDAEMIYLQLLIFFF